ncbi:MAG: phosphoribosylaminoimidazolesuccinocarboxamide synthase [Fluviicola sp.]|nr:phosphoribosylaminoimidazolesuccinocarboxamide synthase [Fluviicola sp.]
MTRTRVIDNVSGVSTKNNIIRLLFIYGVITIGLFYFAYEGFLNGKRIQPSLFSLFGLSLIYGIFISLNNSTVSMISRQHIEEVKFKKGNTGLTRSRFEVFFKDNNDKLKKRLILLPVSMNDGDIETEKAIQIMIDENLLS